MAELQDLIFETDLFSINEDELNKVAIDYEVKLQPDLDEKLGLKLWEKMSESLEKRTGISKRLKETVFAGRTSVTWFVFYKAKENFRTENISPTVTIPELQRLKTKEPVYIGGAEIENGNYILRFIVKTGVGRRSNGVSVVFEPKVTFVSVLVSASQDFIEIRCESKLADKIIKIIRQNFINDQASITRVESFTNEDIQRLVDELNGSLIQASLCPEMLVAEMNSEQVEAVNEVLVAIDTYFKMPNINELRDQLDKVRQICGDTLMMPFAALVLTGMDKISMGARGEKDLQKQPLYKIFEPYIKHLGDYISFPVVENENKKMYTIRRGTGTKSIVFLSDATEKVIEIVRNKILYLERKAKEEETDGEQMGG
jgi:hypothetical protein